LRSYHSNVALSEYHKPKGLNTASDSRAVHDLDLAVATLGLAQRVWHAAGGTRVLLRRASSRAARRRGRAWHHSRHTPSAWLLYDAIFMRRHDTSDLVPLLKVIQSDEDGEAS